MPIRVTARVNTFNEEDTIADALASLAWADEILVVDSGSSDRTVEIASRLAHRVIHHPFANFSAQHAFADTQCTYDWVFVLDADERVTPELAHAIAQILERDSAGPGPCNGYRVARRTQYLGRWIRHSGWYPDWKLRLYLRSAAHWEGGSVHERAVVPGPVGTLSGDLLHYTRRSLREHLEVMNRYTGLAAADWLAAGRRPSRLQLALAPPAAFFRSYIWKQGFRDGWQGLVIAYLAALYVHIRQAKVWEAGTFVPHSESTVRGNLDTP